MTQCVAADDGDHWSSKARTSPTLDVQKLKAAPKARALMVQAVLSLGAGY
jgi:hypothetical protein